MSESLGGVQVLRHQVWGGWGKNKNQNDYAFEEVGGLGLNDDIILE